MNQDNLDNIRKDKYNDWGERQPLIGVGSKIGSVTSQLMSRNDISEIEKSVHFLHEITGCKGFEFVGFSNVKIESPIGLSGGIVVYPCFLPSTVGGSMDDPIARASIQMSMTSRFIYDGWLPIEEMSDDTIRKSIRELREILGTFPLVSGGQFDWEAKYPISMTNKETHYYSEKEIKTIEGFSSTIDKLSQTDRQALLRSIGWLAECKNNSNTESKFLYSVLCIESLCSYIEDSDVDSVFHKFAQDKKSKSERKVERESCIHSTLKEFLEKNPTVAITEAYFNCVVGIRKKLYRHLENIFSDKDEELIAFFNKGKDGLSLYDLRHTIAHGSHDIISEEDRSRIDRNAYKVEHFALRYIWFMLNNALDFYNESSSIHASLPTNLRNVIISNRSMYKGPVDMGLLYIV